MCSRRRWHGAGRPAGRAWSWACGAGGPPRATCGAGSGAGMSEAVQSGQQVGRSSVGWRVDEWRVEGRVDERGGVDVCCGQCMRRLPPAKLASASDVSQCHHPPPLHQRQPAEPAGTAAHVWAALAPHPRGRCSRSPAASLLAMHRHASGRHRACIGPASGCGRTTGGCSRSPAGSHTPRTPAPAAGACRAAAGPPHAPGSAAPGRRLAPPPTGAA
jgi:hypothetical protein